MKPVRVLVARQGNAFMTDLAAWIAEAARQAGRDVTLGFGPFPQPDGAINLVVAPHEFFGLAHDAHDDSVRRAVALSVPVCTEQPGTPWFNLTAELIAGAPAVLDINQHGVGALRQRGFDAHHLRLGGVPSMAAPTVDRDLDVVFLGGSTPRRNARLASLAPLLWNRATDLRLFRFSAPVGEGAPGVVFGADKYELLARSRILLNIHRDDVKPGYFEWARMVEAMANGCAVLTESSTGYEPLVPGEHFVASDQLELELARLLDDPDECRRVGEAARAAVLDEHPLVASLAPILDRLDEADLDAGSVARRRRPLVRQHKPPLLPEFRPYNALRHDIYAAWMGELHLARQLDQMRCRVVHGADDVVQRAVTPAYEGARPDVTVVLTLFNYADLVGETLDSIVASTGVEHEIVVVDDHSRDAGRSVVAAFMQQHPDVPILLLGSEVNRGLSESRNLGIEAARGELVMIIDADNLVYPNCLARLRDALVSDPGAAFAYATLEAFGADPGVRSELAWHPRWLCEVNYIDAQAMVRRSTFERHGGYRDVDDFTYGWEDWVLWLRLAAAGERGVHVRQMLGRYRTQASSMVSITNLVADELRARVVAQFPTLPWPEHDAPADVDPWDLDDLEALVSRENELSIALADARRRQEYRQRPLSRVGDLWSRLRARVRRLR